MKPSTLEWIEKAEADYAIALLARRSRKKHSRDIVCFHLQQCVEKYLKARLEEAAISIPKTHNVLHLLTLVLQVEPLWVSFRPAMGTITAYAVEFRYPGPHRDIARDQHAFKGDDAFSRDRAIGSGALTIA